MTISSSPASHSSSSPNCLIFKGGNCGRGCCGSNEADVKRVSVSEEALTASKPSQQRCTGPDPSLLLANYESHFAVLTLWLSSGFQRGGAWRCGAPASLELDGGGRGVVAVLGGPGR